MQFTYQRLKIIVSRLFIVVYKFHNLYLFGNYDEKCGIVAIECGKLATRQIYSAKFTSTMRVLSLSDLAEKADVELIQEVIFSASSLKKSEFVKGVGK